MSSSVIRLEGLECILLIYEIKIFGFYISGIVSYRKPAKPWFAEPTSANDDNRTRSIQQFCLLNEKKKQF